MKNIKMSYFALIREKVGKSNEILATSATTADDLYQEIQSSYDFHFSKNHLRVAINNEFVELSTPLNEGDHVVFIPPVAGG